ncbi:MAG: hypothetical protein V3V10_06790 [Planctomycetota bacterium]
MTDKKPHIMLPPAKTFTMNERRENQRRTYDRRRPARDLKMVVFACRFCENKHHVMRELRVADIQTLQREGWVFPDGPLPDAGYKVGCVSGLCPEHAANDARG